MQKNKKINPCFYSIAITLKVSLDRAPIKYLKIYER